MDNHEAFRFPEIRHEEIGHVMTGGGLRGGRERAQRDDPVLAQDREKLLHLGVRSTERAAAVCLSIIRPVDAIESAASRIARRS